MLKIIFRNALLGGIFTALLCVFLFVLLQFLGFFPLAQHRFVYLGFYFFGMVLTLRRLAIQSQQSLLPHWQSVGTSLLFNVVTALFYALGVALFLGIFSEYVEQHQTAIIEKVQNDLAHAEEKSEQELFSSLLKDVQKITLTDLVLDIWLKTSLIGFVMAMGTGVMFRKYR